MDPEHKVTVSTERRPRVLVVDDFDGVRTQLRWALKEHFEVSLAASAEEAREAILKEQFDAVTLDLGLPPDPNGPTQGLQLLENFLNCDPAMKVVVITGNTDHDNAVRAVKLGAYDYVLKPINTEELAVILQRACNLSRLDREALRLDGSAPPSTPGKDIIGESAAMRQIFDTVRRVARTDITVLISGGSGTGKEVVARLIHDKSPRRQRPFLAINCGAIPENLVESELFGHEKGSFTGAHAQRKGRLEMADGGTVFLDEIAELPPPTQVKLLRVLQERHLERVGGRELIPLDVRVLAATNKDIQKAIQERQFREDLYYRLAVVSIHIPPLRERLEDLRALAQYFLEAFSSEYKVRRRHFSAEALAAMDTYTWPGNVRELENRIKRAVIMAEGRRITAADLALDGDFPLTPLGALKETRNEVERRVLTEALKRYRGKVSRAAHAIQISRTAFHQLLSKHNIDPGPYKTE
jgi:two-component system NtrC family response regulator